MSATNRGGERHPDDYYRTPGWATRAMLRSRVALLAGPVLDPGCGDGAILRELRAAGLDCWGVELDEGRAAEAGAVAVDFLALEVASAAVGSVVGNPPYRQAEAFVRRSLDLVPPGGRVVMLLRLGFLAGRRRAAGSLWSSLSWVGILTRRPSFTGRGTDASDYAWIEWTRGYRGPVVLEHLRCDP